MTSEKPRPIFCNETIYSGGRCGTGDWLDIEHSVMIDTDGTRDGEFYIRANDTVIRVPEHTFIQIVRKSADYLVNKGMIE